MKEIITTIILWILRITSTALFIVALPVFMGLAGSIAFRLLDWGWRLGERIL